MKARLERLGLWLWDEDEREVPSLLDNLTFNQIRAHAEEAKALRALFFIHVVVSNQFLQEL